jgi:hypothetical protein
VEVLVGVFSVFVRAETAVNMTVKLGLIFNGFGRLIGSVLNWAVVVVVSVRVVRRSRTIMQVQPHAETGVELGVMGGFDKTQVGCSAAKRVLGAQQIVLGQFIDFVQHNHIRVLQLLLQNESDGVGVRRGFGRVSSWYGLSILELSGEQERGVDNCEDGVELEIVPDFWPREGLHHRRWQGESGGFDEHVIDFVFASAKLLHDWQEIVVHGAADASVGKVVDFSAAFGVRRTDQGAVHGNFTELVDENREATIRILSEQAAQERCFS